MVYKTNNGCVIWESKEKAEETMTMMALFPFLNHYDGEGYDDKWFWKDVPRTQKRKKKIHD